METLSYPIPALYVEQRNRVAVISPIVSIVYAVFFVCTVSQDDVDARTTFR